MLARVRSLAVVLAVVGVVGCVGGPAGDGPAGATLALEWQADPVAVKLIGLFAFDAKQEGLRCQTYLAGDYDPFVSGQPEGLSFFAVDQLEAGEQLLDGVTTGSRLILVEAYDAGGKRIFFGCAGPVGIEANHKATVEVDLVPDPSAE